MSNTIIRKLYNKRLIEFADENDFACAVDNQAFDPTKDARDGRYLDAVLLPATTVSTDLAGAHRGYRGVYQIDICTRRRIGTSAADGICDLLAAKFSVNLRLTDTSGLVVQVRTPLHIPGGRQSANGWTVSASFSYSSDNF
jgi:hypothetical protein